MRASPKGIEWIPAFSAQQLLSFCFIIPHMLLCNATLTIESIFTSLSCLNFHELRLFFSAFLSHSAGFVRLFVGFCSGVLFFQFALFISFAFPFGADQPLAWPEHICRVFTVTKAKGVRRNVLKKYVCYFLVVFVLRTIPRTVHNVNVMSTFYQFTLPFLVRAWLLPLGGAGNSEKIWN